MRLIGEKWSTISTNIEKEKLTRKEVLEERLRNLEDRIKREKPDDENKFRVYYIYYLQNI